MSPSPPFAQLLSTFHVTVFTAVMQLLIAAAVTVVAFALRRLRNYQRTILSELHYHRRMRAVDAQSLAHLAEQDQTITHHVNAGFERLERELRSHTTSDLLHAPERADVP